MREDGGMAEELTRITTSEVESMELAQRIGGLIDTSLVIALYGDMGSGKTTFVRGLARGLGVSGVVNSPTYVLMQRYEGRLTLDHYDAWMEGREREILADGAHELLGDGGVSVIEWADRVSDWLPESRLEVHLRVTGLDQREIRLSWPSGDPLPEPLYGLGEWSVSSVS